MIDAHEHTTDEHIADVCTAPVVKSSLLESDAVRCLVDCLRAHLAAAANHNRAELFTHACTEARQGSVVQ